MPLEPKSYKKVKRTKAEKEAITKEKVATYSLYRHNKMVKPRQFPGKNIFQKDRNDGIRVCLIHELFQGKQIDKLAFFRIYETKEGFFWKPRKMPRKKGGVFEMWDVVSVNRDCAREIAEAILEVAGEAGELGEEKVKELGEKTKEDEIWEISKDY